ncbi:MAG: VapA/VapB family virulence-associated protein [Rhodoplanes sp.]
MRNTAGADQLLTKLYQTFKRLEPLVPEQEIEGLYNAIDDKKWLEGVLSQFSDDALSAHKIDRPNAALFRHAASASLYAVTVIFPVRIKLDAPSIGKTFIGSGKGLFGSIVAQSWGTLYYNDINDLVNGSDFECNFLAVYANVNFIRGGQTYATYQGGGTPLAGIGGGSGQWT